MRTVIASALIAASVVSAAPVYASPMEDSPSWDCATDGNRICGPGNAQGIAAGCYSDTGVMVAAWPCYVVVNPDGSSDVYTVDAR